LIAKDPDAHIGERYIVYGVVTQFDAATGPEEFLAYVDGIWHADGYEYPTNTDLVGESVMFEQMVEGDVFTAKIEMIGACTYDTQIGGSTTAPQLQVDSITVTAAAS
jgi:hypothetical protein